MSRRLTMIAMFRFCRILSVAILLWIYSHAPAYSQTLPTAALIQKAWRSYASSIRQMKGKYQSRMLMPPQRKRDPRVHIFEDELHEVTFLADIEGDRTRLEIMRDWKFSWFDPNEHFAIREIRSFDKRIQQVLVHTFAKSPVPVEVPRDVPMELNINTGDTVDSPLGPWYFSGLRLRNIPNAGFAEVLEEDLQVERTEAVDGHSCILVNCEASGRKLQMWLDSKVDYLPPKFIVAHADGTDALTYSVREFAQYNDGVGNQQWCPLKGSVEVHLTGQTYEYVLVDLKLNGAVQDSDFTIDRGSLPPGVCVTDRGNVSYTSGRMDLYQELKKLTAEQDRILDERFAAAFPPETPQ